MSSGEHQASKKVTVLSNLLFPLRPPLPPLNKLPQQTPPEGAFIY